VLPTDARNLKRNAADVAVRCSVLQRAVAYCSVLQYVADRYAQSQAQCCWWCPVLQSVAECCSVLQSIAVCDAVCCRWMRTDSSETPFMVPCVAACCSVLQSVLPCVADGCAQLPLIVSCVAVCCCVVHCDVLDRISSMCDTTHSCV